MKWLLLIAVVDMKLLHLHGVASHHIVLLNVAEVSTVHTIYTYISFKHYDSSLKATVNCGWVGSAMFCVTFKLVIGVGVP